MTAKHWNWITMLAIATALALSQVSFAQDTEETETPKVKSPEEIQAEQAELKARKAKAEFDAADYAKKLQELGETETSTTPETAGVSLADKGGYYGLLISYYSLRTAAAEFLEGANIGTNTPVVLTTDLDLSSLGSVWTLTQQRTKAFDSQFEDLANIDIEKSKKELEDAVDSKLAITGMSALSEAASILGAAADFAAYFRVKRVLSGRTVTASDEALLASIASVMPEDKYDLVIPQLTLKRNGWFGRWLSDARTKEAAAREKHNDLKEEFKPETLDKRIKAKEEELKGLKTGTDERKKADRDLRLLKETKGWWTKVLARYTLVTGEFTNYVKAMTTRHKDTNRAPIEELYFMDTVESLGSNVRILIAKTVSQGADVETSSGTFRKTKISYVGGSVCLFFLIDKHGTVVKADVIPIVGSKSFAGRINTEAPSRIDESTFVE